jgi:hypothetical protein
MGSRSRRSSTRGVAIALCAFATAVPAAPASGAAPAQDKGYLESTVRYLQEAQNSDGGFGETPGGPSNPDISAWAAIGLAAAGINPQEQARPGGRSVYDYLTEHARELSLTTDFERDLLVADAAGTSPYEFGGVNLVHEIIERKVREGNLVAFTHEASQTTVQDVSDTVFAILALSPVHEPVVQEAVQQATTWLIEQQNTAAGPGEGSWNAACLPSMPECTEADGTHGEVDMTAAAVEALNAAGDPSSKPQERALKFLHGAQKTDEREGGFPEFFPRQERETQDNAASSSWALQALWSAGANPESWLAPDTQENPLQYLASLQQPDGAIYLRPGDSKEAVWWTAYTAAALAGQPLPVPAVPLRPAPPPSPPSSAAPSTVSPALSLASQPASRPGHHPRPRVSHARGVLAGGGGRGARLFSRPQPGGQAAGPGPVREPQSTNPAQDGAAAGGPPGRPGRATKSDAPAPTSSRPASTPDQPRLTGVLLDEPLASRAAPGLRSAAAVAGGSWTTTAILVGLALLVMAGARLERRRPRVIADGR